MSGRAARASRVRKAAHAAERRRQIFEAKANVFNAWMSATDHAMRNISRIAAGLAERYPESARKWSGNNVFFDVVIQSPRKEEG